MIGSTGTFYVLPDKLQAVTISSEMLRQTWPSYSSLKLCALDWKLEKEITRWMQSLCEVGSNGIYVVHTKAAATLKASHCREPRPIA